MIKLKELLIEATIACGECLSYVWKMGIINQDNKQANKKMKITYGTVQNKHVSNNKRYRHAWVEDGNLVKDWQTMVMGGSKYAKKGWPKKEFYSFWKPKVDKKFTPAEVAHNWKTKKTIMGWDW